MRFKIKICLQILIYDQSGSTVKVGESALTSNALMFVNKLFDNVSLRLLRPQFAMFEKAESDFVIVKIGESDWNAYFSLEEDIEDQVKNLSLTYNSINIDDRNNLDYIDLRFGKKIYYK